MEVNAKDTLWIQDTSNLDSGAVAEPVAIGFKFPSKYMYGLPERAANLVLNTTESSEPYYMFNTDRFPHFYQTNVSLYGSLPYLTSHEANLDSSVMWMNSAPTWVDLFGQKDSLSNEATIGTFNSMGGQIEFFIFSSSISPKRVQKSLSDISGYIPMPPLHSLGFHFSKYEYFTARSLA